MPRLTAPLADGDVLHHRHHMLTRHLPRLDPALKRVQGLLIATHIGKVAVYMKRDREAKAQARNTDKKRGYQTS